MTGAGQLDRLVQFRRGTPSDDGLTKRFTMENYGDPVWAKKTDVNDAERWRAGGVGAVLTTRFVVRWSSFTAGISTDDELVSEGITYNITGVKEAAGRRQWIELTCASQPRKAP